MAVTTSIPAVPDIAALHGLIPVTSVRDEKDGDYQQISVFFGKRTRKYFWWADGGFKDEPHMRHLPTNLHLLLSGEREECVKAVRRWGVREDSLPVEKFQEPA